MIGTVKKVPVVSVMRKINNHWLRLTSLTSFLTRKKGTLRKTAEKAVNIQIFTMR